LEQAAANLAQILKDRQLRLVLAESCTAGLVAATLSRTPGISAWLCGSAVVYQEGTKVAWLGVSLETLEQFTAVSQETGFEMAQGVLRQTPHADVVASITGHLGPHAPVEQDGLVFATLLWRDQPETVISERWQLGAPGEPENDGVAVRLWRQQAAATRLLDMIATHLAGPDFPEK
jgi:PncC family amidohydrolase